jgi:hypothetical protein
MRKRRGIRKSRYRRSIRGLTYRLGDLRKPSVGCSVDLAGDVKVVQQRRVVVGIVALHG